MDLASALDVIRGSDNLVILFLISSRLFKFSDDEIKAT